MRPPAASRSAPPRCEFCNVAEFKHSPPSLSHVQSSQSLLRFHGLFSIRWRSTAATPRFAAASCIVRRFSSRELSSSDLFQYLRQISMLKLQNQRRLGALDASPSCDIASIRKRLRAAREIYDFRSVLERLQIGRGEHLLLFGQSCFLRFPLTHTLACVRFASAFDVATPMSMLRESVALLAPTPHLPLPTHCEPPRSRSLQPGSTYFPAASHFVVALRSRHAARHHRRALRCIGSRA